MKDVYCVLRTKGACSREKRKTNRPAINVACGTPKKSPWHALLCAPREHKPGMRNAVWISFLMLLAVQGTAYATCGTHGGPGYRGPDGKCQSNPAGTLSGLHLFCCCASFRWFPKTIFAAPRSSSPKRGASPRHLAGNARAPVAMPESEGKNGAVWAVGRTARGREQPS
jgi:hypothetical protein